MDARECARARFDRLQAAVGLTQTEMAARLGVTQSALAHWRRAGIPAGRVGPACALAAERGSPLQPHDLRPDLFQPPPSEAA